MDLADWIAASAGRTPDKPALCGPGAALSYADLAAHCETIASALAAAGVAAGDRVAWLGFNSPALVATLFACARLGAALVPLNWRLAAPEHRAMLQSCAPALLCVDEPFVASAAEQGIAPGRTRCIVRRPAASAGGNEPAAGWLAWDRFIGDAGEPVPRLPVDPRTPALLCFTSGSTGRPKGALLSHDALAANADASVEMHALSADDRVLTTLPLFHVGGMNIQTLPALRAGCTVTLHERFDADATFTAIEHERITLAVLVPAQLEALIAHPRWADADVSSLRMITTGSTLVPERLIRAVHARGVPLVQVWGATETTPIAACLRPRDALRKAGSTGSAAAGCELRVVDDQDRDVAAGASGEILVRGRNVMNGYWRDPEATASALAGGWFHSGDSGHFDAEGYLYIDGRLRDMIISGGENVSPAEVEAVLLECPAVAEAAVVGRPDARWGETVVAVVTARPGATLTSDRVLALFDGRLARFKWPKQVYIVDALPRTSLGKVRKEDVRQLVGRLSAPGPAPPGR